MSKGAAMEGKDESFQQARSEIKRRLETIRFIDRAQVSASAQERDEAWEEFYDECPDDLAFLIAGADHLIHVLSAAADVACQIRDKRAQASETEREAAICELARFLEDNVAEMTRGA